MNIYAQLFLQFFHIGLFSFGGGYATLPFLYAIAEKYHWYTTNQLTDMLAISSITPGPIGINVATYAGFTTTGILGSLIATISIILPSLIITSFVFKILDKFKANKTVQGVIRALKPAGCALLSAVGIRLLFVSNLHLLGTIILITLISTSLVKKQDPLVYFVVCAIIGLALGRFNLIGV